MDKINIFGIKIDNLTRKEIFTKIRNFLGSKKQHYIVLPYSEFIVRAQKDKEFKKILNESDLSLCESRGLYLVLKFLKMPIKENVYGVDLIYGLVAIARRLKAGIFLFGGKKGVAEKVREKLGGGITGTESGYQNTDVVIDKINRIKPEILLVGLGSPKQEKWIYRNLEKMPSVKLAVGVGGAFDFISGRLKRAPKIFQKAGMEWTWRLVLQPKRIKRVYNGVAKLLFMALKFKVKH